MNSLNILSKNIRFNDGLYSLNDLHKASGAEDKNRPTKFLRLDQTKELIQEISTCPDMDNPVKSIHGVGTWVCKELVYSYAMWVSAKFHLHVIRAFDKPQNLSETSGTQDTDKLQLLNTMVRSMKLSEPVVIIPQADAMDMVRLIRGYQIQISQLQKHPVWVDGVINNIKQATGLTLGE